MERLKQQLQAEEIRFAENESLAAHLHLLKIRRPGRMFLSRPGDGGTALPRDRTVQSVRREILPAGQRQ